jgi:hypothetical protein
LEIVVQNASPIGNPKNIENDMQGQAVPPVAQYNNQQQQQQNFNQPQQNFNQNFNSQNKNIPKSAPVKVGQPISKVCPSSFIPPIVSNLFF